MFVFSGRKLQRARGELPREALALSVGVSAAAVAHWEANRRSPSRAMIRQLAGELGVEPRDLVDEDPMFAVVTS
ncbi:MAG: helix-turn-helix transcriptional regulator [Actinobacteria bacterium]|nr:helix-turn-helix transcriptional regulator [Actinomycetota bacterium]